MNNKQILAKTQKIKGSSIAYQKACILNDLGPKDEIGGHVVYTSKETEDYVCPSDEFVTSIFEECAAGLGFKYERR